MDLCGAFDAMLGIHFTAIANWAFLEAIALPVFGFSATCLEFLHAGILRITSELDALLIPRR